MSDSKKNVGTLQVATYTIKMEHIDEVERTMKSAVAHFNRDHPDARGISHSTVIDPPADKFYVTFTFKE